MSAVEVEHQSIPPIIWAPGYKRASSIAAQFLRFDYLMLSGSSHSSWREYVISPGQAIYGTAL